MSLRRRLFANEGRQTEQTEDRQTDLTTSERATVQKVDLSALSDFTATEETKYEPYRRTSGW